MTCRPVVAHGTLEGFLEHRRVNETACTACRQAWKGPRIVAGRCHWTLLLVWSLWRQLCRR